MDSLINHIINLLKLNSSFIENGLKKILREEKGLDHLSINSWEHIYKKADKYKNEDPEIYNLIGYYFYCKYKTGGEKEDLSIEIHRKAADMGSIYAVHSLYQIKKGEMNIGLRKIFLEKIKFLNYGKYELAILEMENESYTDALSLLNDISPSFINYNDVIIAKCRCLENLESYDEYLFQVRKILSNKNDDNFFANGSVLLTTILHEHVGYSVHIEPYGNAGFDDKLFLYRISYKDMIVITELLLGFGINRNIIQTIINFVI